MTKNDNMLIVLKCWGSSKHKDSLVTAGDIYSIVPDELITFDGEKIIDNTLKEVMIDDSIEALVKEGLVCKEQVGYYYLSGIAIFKIETFSKKTKGESL